jgi:hypothetical protein
VRVHSFTLSHTPRSMRHDSQASLLACNLVSPCFSHEPKATTATHMNSKSKIPTYNNASFDNFNFDNEKINYTTTNLVIHYFLDVPKIMDYENIIYCIIEVKIFTF